MKLEFESWLEENNVPNSAMNLFKEAIICYKISAYRSSFIMSYIGFQNILKEKIVNATKIPEGIPEKYWKTINSKVNDDKVWDETIVECVMKKSDGRIFMVNDDITKQYEYWKVIRNDCAHGKSNIISYSHTEAFWLFIQAYYKNFKINCGVEAILNIISKHYDRRYTEKDKDCTYIADYISNTLTDEELEPFIDTLFSYLNKNRLFHGRKYIFKYFEDSDGIELIRKVLNNRDSRLRINLLKFIKSNNGKIYLFDFIKVFPETLSELINDSSFARLMWTSNIFNSSNMSDGAWYVVKYLLKRHMEHERQITSIIPDNEFDEFIRCLYFWSKGIVLGADKEIISLLTKTKFYNIMRSYLFIGGCDWNSKEDVNSHAKKNIDEIIEYIRRCELDGEVVKGINKIIRSRPSFIVIHTIKQHLFENSSIVSKYREIVNQYNMEDYSIRY